MATRLFVGNLPENVEEKNLELAFASFGQITNLDLKSKSSVDDTLTKSFAFVTLSASNYNIESCIKFFANNDFHGKRLYVTRARESFLERLQRERAEAQQKQNEKEQQQPPQKQPVIKLSDKLNPRKRKFENDSNHIVSPSSVTLKKSHVSEDFGNDKLVPGKPNKHESEKKRTEPTKKDPQMEKEDDYRNNMRHNGVENAKRKLDSEKKRMEAMKQKRQEFKTKQMIVKTGLTGVDKVQNKKVIFSDDDEDMPTNHTVNGVKSMHKPGKDLFDDDDYDDADEEVNFEIKKQFEGKKGQKVLDLQSRYKSDKRFVLDERFIDDENSDGEKDEGTPENEDQIEINQTDEKAKQLNILQDVLGVTIKRKIPDDGKDKKNKHKIGMLRFDPTQPEHAKFLAPVEDIKQQATKKSKKKKDKQTEEPQIQEARPEEPRPEVSKETFYKVSETLKEAIAQPTTFSLRSLFVNREEREEQKNENYIPLEPQQKKTKVKNPLDPGEKNPFRYDSSDSEPEEEDKEIITEVAPAATENKAVWRETLFFAPHDQRLKDGIAFFNNTTEIEPQKERRELKSLMKKRIYNKERKNQMFQKKIGGRKKTMKKSFKRKS